MARTPQIWMETSKLLSQKGWRRTATINVVLACACNLTLLTFLLVSISQPGASLFRPSIIFNGSCTTSSRLNLSFHLLINAVSTAVLASSNFFMQILNAPSRQEINNAHTWLQALDIGIPSMRNLSHVSRLKSASWLVFLITSIPIHLLFNSAVFETTYQGSQWYLTLATEAFTQGAPFFPPGASLLPAGNINPYGDVANGWGEIGGYGEEVSVDQYWNATSAVRKKIASVAEESHSWTVLNSAQCYSEYVSCNPRTKYGDVVFILDPPASEEGWKRSDIFSFDPSANLSTKWDARVPPNAANSLWFSAQCHIFRTKSISGGDDLCTNSCLKAMGRTEYEFKIGHIGMTQSPWSITFFPAVRNHDEFLFPEGVEFNHKFDSLHVDHCLAQPTEPSCKVGLSNTLLLIVILSILVKIIQGGVVALKLPSESLVTPGDAIESFILYPDSVTQGLSTLDIVDTQEIEFGKRRHWPDFLHPGLTAKVRPRKWKKHLRRFRSIIPYTTWIKTYFIFIAGVALLTAGFAASALETSNNYSGSLDHSDGVFSYNVWKKSPGYIPTLLLANTPQLILSFCYFSYNSLLTQIHVEKEWNTFSISYRPLRVSYPAGQQISSYRLQLPYRHSVPLILISIGLHWLVSNAVFLYVNEGGYWHSNGLAGLSDAYSVPEGSLIAIGYSPLFFLALFISGFLLVIFPPALLGHFQIKGDMVAGGWNSLVISAACHIPNRDNKQDESSFNDTDRYLREYVACAPEDPTGVFVAREEDDENFNKLLDLTRRKLRWGAMELQRKVTESIPDDEKAIFHLGFGGEEHDISEPKDGQCYI